MAQATSENRQFPYGAHPAKLILGIIFFGFCGLFAIAIANSNDRGLIIDGIIRLSPQGATTFWQLIALTSLAFVPLGIFQIIQNIINPQTLVLDENGLHVRKHAWSSTDTLIPYSQIRGVRFQNFRGHIYMRIYHTQGTKRLSASNFKSPEQFRQFSTDLKDRAHIVRPAVA